MNQTEKLEIDVDDLMEKVRRKVVRRKARQPSAMISPFPSARSDAERLQQFQDIRKWSNEVAVGLNVMRQHNRARTELPRTLNRFPINRLGILKRIILAGYELLFREQRMVNTAVADAINDMHRISQALSGFLTQIGDLEARIKALEARGEESYSAVQGELNKERRQLSDLQRDLQQLDKRIELLQRGDEKG